MREAFHHYGPTDGDQLEQSDRLVVLFEPDETARAAATAALTDGDPLVDVVAMGDFDSARRVFDELRPDCIVLGTVGRVDFLEGTDAPVALYTDADPANVEPTMLDAADTLVERRGDGSPALLVRKVRALLSDDADRSRTQYAMARALSRAESGADHGTHQFLVDDGRLVWASEPFNAVFPVEDVTGTPPESGSFDDRLRALLADSPAAIPIVTRTRRGVASGRESFTVHTDAGEHQFVHTGYRLPGELDSLRLEVFEDVTANVRRAARTELLELLVEAAKDGLYTLDAQGNIDFCNTGFAEMLGYDREELIGWHTSQVLAEGELEWGQSRIKQLLDDDSLESIMLDMTFRDRFGEHLDVEINFTLLPSEDDTYAGLMGVVRDITDRKQRERELQRYRRLVEAARDPMFVLDPAGELTLCNDALERVVGTDTASGQPLTALFADGDGGQFADIIENLRTGETEWEQFELGLTDSAGRERQYEATVGALGDDGFVGTVGTLRDITERTRRTYELDLLKQVLTRVLRHNIRSELTVIQSHATRLIAGEADPEASGEAILKTTESLLSTSEKAREIERLVDRDASRIAQDLAAVVDSAVDPVRQWHSDVALEVDVPAVTVMAHPSLETAVENAVENAVVHAAPSVRVTAAVERERVELRVADDGPGMPENEIAALEEHEETPLQHTSGAGLWLIDRIVGHSDGDLAFDTGPDGTTVRMTLERAEK